MLQIKSKLNLKTLIASAFMSTIILIVGCSENVPNADLDRVLDVTTDSLYQFEKKGSSSEESAPEEFAKVLEENIGQANPKVHPGPVGIEAGKDGAFAGYYDENDNKQRDSGEKDLFKIEIDGEGQRLIASDSNGYVRDQSFSGGMGLLAGMLIGSMLGRQRAAGVNPKSLSSKKAMSKSQYKSAKSRSSSGSHTKGK